MRSRTFLAVAASAALLACSDIHFETDATYRAPRGGFDLVIHATGVVPAGADLAAHATADVHVAPTSHGRGFDVRATLPTTAGAPRIADLIRDAGYDAPAAELDEANVVVDLALRGSKATLVQGQTKALQVVSVRFRYQ